MKLLFLTSRFPYPLEKGDKLRAYHLIKSLSKDFDIYLFAVNESIPRAEWLKELQPYCKKIETAVISKTESAISVAAAFNKRGIPFQVAYFWNNGAMQHLNKFVAEIKPDAVFCHLIRMAEYAKKINIHPSMLDYMDAFSTGMDRVYQTTNSFMKIPVKMEATRLKKYESNAFNWFDHHIIISEQDRAHIPHPENKKIEVIANGVDFNYYIPAKADKKTDVLFIGNMSYPPNISSAIYTVKEILPALHKLNPEVNVVIAGANPVKKIRDLANEFVKVSGWVEDPRILFNESKVMVAPMLISIGLQNKILQAMAMKVPCVISKLANNAIGAKENECVLVADSPQEYAQKINTLLKDANMRTTIAENAYQFVRTHFNWEINTAKIKSLYNS